MRTREELSALIEERLSSAAGRSALGELTIRLIVEEALEGEARNALGRDYYERGAESGQGYRNGTRPGRLKTAEGSVTYSAPQIAGLDHPYRSETREHLKGQTEALKNLAVEMLARGLSARDIEDAFCDESGRLLLSKTAAAELGKQLWEDYQAFKSRDLDECEIAHLFVDGIAYFRLPIGHRRATRTTNLLERPFVEERRRLKIIPNAFGEKAVLKLGHGTEPTRRALGASSAYDDLDDEIPF
jgi:transposase-like protein